MSRTVQDVMIDDLTRPIKNTSGTYWLIVFGK